VDAALGALLAARGRLPLASAIPGALAFWCLGALALGRIPLTEPRPATCAAASAGVWCSLSNRADVRFVAFVLLGVLGITAGTSLVAMLTGPVLSLIAGFGWPSYGPLGALARQRAGAHRRRRARAVSRLGRDGSAAAARLAWYPAGDTAVRPTRIGNAFAAMDQRVTRRHGLGLATCWPLLELAVPRPTSDRLETASRLVAGRIQNLIWCVAALVWVPAFPAPLAFLIAGAAVILAGLLWWAASGGVEQYCALIEATVAASRRAMYVAIGWPVPASTTEEPAQGKALTGYLDRRSDPGHVVLGWPSEPGT